MGNCLGDITGSDMGLVSSGGATGQVLTKQSAAPYDYTWQDAAAGVEHTHPVEDITGLGNSATLDVGTTAGTVAAGDHTHPGGSEAFPVGAVFIAVVSTNPATLLGYGTWSAFAAGKLLVGLDSGDTDFDTVEETGGAKTSTALLAHTHTITDGGHNHTQNSHNHTQDAHTHTQNSHNHTQDAHSHIITSQTATTGGATSYEHGTLDTSSAEAEATETTATTVATNQAATAVNQNATATNQAATATNISATTGITGTNSAGSGSSFSLMNPFIVVYMWKRTA